MKKLVINVDFDNTIVSDAYPKIGKLMYGCKETLTEFKAHGHKIIISSCRCNEYEADMRRFLDDNAIPYDYINENDPDLIERYGSDSRKISCDVQIDDRNLGGFPGWERARSLVRRLAEKKPLIICVIGESGTGKTTLAEWIERRYGVSMIQSYTDRKPRHLFEDGHTFVSSSEFDSFTEEDMVAYTKFGNHRYCCLYKDIRMENTYVIDEDGYLMLLQKHRNDYDIKSIRMYCDPKVLEIRGISDLRISRDKGRFSLPFDYFNFVLDTTNKEPHRYGHELEQILFQWLNRGL
jgi:hypothetical protein